MSILGIETKILYLLLLDLSVKDYGGRTSFHYACINGCIEVVELLIQNFKFEKDLNSADNNGSTAFHLACEYGQSKIVNLLWKQLYAKTKNEFNDKNKYGFSSFHLALINGFTDTAEMLIDLSNSNNLNLDLGGWEVFHLACKGGQTGIVKLLLETYEETEIQNVLNAKNMFGQTAFHLACLHGFTETAEILIHESILKNIKLDLGGWKIFHGVCKNGQTNVVEMLLKKYAEQNIDLNTENPYGGWKSFDLAKKNGHTKTVDMILQKSAKLNIKLYEKEWDSLSPSNWVDTKSKESVMASLGKLIF